MSGLKSIDEAGVFADFIFTVLGALIWCSIGAVFINVFVPKWLEASWLWKVYSASFLTTLVAAIGRWDNVAWGAMMVTLTCMIAHLLRMVLKMRREGK